jgi:hypothetical protein
VLCADAPPPEADYGDSPPSGGDYNDEGNYGNGLIDASAARRDLIIADRDQQHVEEANAKVREASDLGT